MVLVEFLPMLGVQPALGRTFTPEDDRPDAPATVILAAAFWKLRYSGDPAIVGKTIWLDAKPYTVIGVMPFFVCLYKLDGRQHCTGVDPRWA